MGLAVLGLLGPRVDALDSVNNHRKSRAKPRINLQGNDAVHDTFVLIRILTRAGIENGIDAL